VAELDNVAVGVRHEPWSGHGVRLQVHGASVQLEPADAADLARRLTDAASEAVHADRAARRG